VALEVSLETILVGVGMLVLLTLVVMSVFLVLNSRNLAKIAEGLTKATDHLAKIQTMPRLMLTRVPHFEGSKGALIVEIANKGIGRAFEIHLFATIGDSNEFEVNEFISGSRNLDSDQEVWFELFTSRSGERLILKVLFQDVEGTQYQASFESKIP
jgi:hypothetical protein